MQASHVTLRGSFQDEENHIPGDMDLVMRTVHSVKITLVTQTQGVGRKLVGE